MSEWEKEILLKVLKMMCSSPKAGDWVELIKKERERAIREAADEILHRH